MLTSFFRTNLLTLVEDTVEGCWIGARARAVSEIGSVYSPPRALPGSASSKPAGERHVETLVDISHRERVSYFFAGGLWTDLFVRVGAVSVKKLASAGC